MRTPDSPGPAQGAPALAVRGAAIPFGRRPGLTGLDFTVREGEWVVLVGPSGVGKSTLLGAVAGEVAPSAGRIEIRGKPAGAGAVRRQEVVLLDQRPVLFPHLNVLDNVAFPLRVRGTDVSTRRERAREALALVRLDALAERDPHTLSGGQAHRVALARALVVEPALLLLDEPLAALDPLLRAELRPAMREAVEAVRPAVLMVTHDLTEAGSLADRIGILSRGRLAQLAPPAQLFRAPASPEVARFVGLGHHLEGRVDARGCIPLPGGQSLSTPLAPGSRARALFGPHGVRISAAGAAPSPTPPDAAPPPPTLEGRVVEVRPHPTGSRIVLELPGLRSPDPGELDGEVAHWECDVGIERRLAPGSEVQVELIPERISFFEADDP